MNAPADLAITRLASERDAFPYRAMTFPRFVPVLRRAGRDPGVVAIAAAAGGARDGTPVALALGWLDPNRGGAAELLSLFVQRDARSRGIGRAVLAELERQLRAAGAGSVTSVYLTRLESLDAYEAVLRAREWSPPVRRMLIYRTHRDRLREADWFELFKTPPAGVAIRPWRELTAPERSRLAQDLAARPDRAPNDVNPFRFEDQGIDGSPPEPALSLACLLDGQVVGWNLAHRIAPRAVRFSCSFVWPERQTRLPLLTLLDHAYHRLLQTPYEHVSWAVAPHHEAMVRFNEQKLLPYVDDFDESRAAAKPLG